MIVFIDTSTMVKRYIDEVGTSTVEDLFRDIEQVIVSPVYMIEMNASITRRMNERIISKEDAWHWRQKAKNDFNQFFQVPWSEELTGKAVRFASNFSIRALDAIQLASACMSDTDVFVTSDKKLAQYAQKEMRRVIFI